MKLAFLLAAGTAVLTAQSAGPFTAAQSAAGRTAYQANCSGCHRPDLGGSGEALQLAGSNFMSVWGGRSAGQLVTYIQSSMPPTNRGSLTVETYTALAAYILEANGGTAGSQPLATSTAVRIN